MAIWWLALLGALAIGVGLNGCTRAAFYLQAARGQLDLVSRRVPVEEALADTTIDAQLRERLRLAYDARQFAARSLALPDNKSYLTYVQLDRPYVLWNVIAAPQFSVEPLTWCFPFAGCVSYRGYFREQAARAETERLVADGYDAFYGGVGAYSTLGRFADSILSSMLGGDEVSTIAVIFHELAHQVVYRPSDSPFSESFASFVEREGVRRYLAARDRSADYASYVENLGRREEFAELVQTARAALAEVYGRTLDEASMRAAKEQAIAQLRLDYAALKQRWGGYAGYDGWFGRDLNNAHLASVSTYNQWVSAFDRWLADLDGDLPRFYAEVAALADADDDTVQSTLDALRLRSASTQSRPAVSR